MPDAEANVALGFSLLGDFMILYHVTPTRMLPKILREGLVPQIGPRARLIHEPRVAIYCFGSVASLQNAEWLWGEFDETTSLALLEIKVPSTIRRARVGFEVQVYDPIPPSSLRVISRKFGEEWTELDQPHGD